MLQVYDDGAYIDYQDTIFVRNRAPRDLAVDKENEKVTFRLVDRYTPEWYTRGEKVKQEFSQHNYASTGNGIVYLILAIFGLSIVSMAIMQSDFNSL